VEAEELAAAASAHALRDGGGGGGGGGGLHRYSHRAAQLEEEQNEREHRAARWERGRHSYLREALGRKRGSSARAGREMSRAMVCELAIAKRAREAASLAFFCEKASAGVLLVARFQLKFHN
jgi:hypothetical protein